MYQLCPERKDESKEKLISLTQKRMQRLNTDTKMKPILIHCSRLIRKEYVYSLADSNFGVGLHLETIIGDEMENRLTKKAILELENIWEHYYNWGVGNPYADATRDVFAKKESFYKKPRTYIKCTNIRLFLRRLLYRLPIPCVEIIEDY